VQAGLCTITFHFAPRSPMLYTINRGNIASYVEGQTPILHLVASAEATQAAGYALAFTDGHGTVEITQSFDDLADLNRLDWNVMQARQWADTDIDNDRKRRRQAEFLVYNFSPWLLIDEIEVIRREVKIQVEQILQNMEHKPSVVVRPNWYY